jgi:hypothetical protein
MFSHRQERLLTLPFALNHTNEKNFGAKVAQAPIHAFAFRCLQVARTVKKCGMLSMHAQIR